MRRSLIAATVIFACWLGLPLPANAQQAPDSRADLILVGAPLVASASPMSAHGPTVVATPTAATVPTIDDSSIASFAEEPIEGELTPDPQVAHAALPGSATG